HSKCSAGGFDPERRGDGLAWIVGEVSVGRPGDRVLATDAAHLGLADLVAPVTAGEAAEIAEVDRLRGECVPGVDDRGETLRLVGSLDGPRPARLRAVHGVRIAGVLAVDGHLRRC